MTTQRMPSSVLRLALAVALVLAPAVAACGGDERREGTAAPASLNLKTSNPDGTRGGTLRISSAADVDSPDPGQAYNQFSYMIVTLASQRPLYTYRPSQTEKPTPDTAASDPEISDDGKTITIKIRKGIRFSPPVDRDVTSDDVKYAIERGFLPSVANGYVHA
jgi:peptide/nickel transport system substrate-binding protein